mmetsp:Transcript_60628/g.114445  ORF Transcript_60628/g.114445 Transcript_60628/m.114445 type:complete len:99 (+) Transcript_60628:2-298(+)
MIGGKLGVPKQASGKSAHGGSGARGGSGGKGSKSAPTPAVDPSEKNYKRHLCKYFEEKGWCSRGSQCTFAHGTAELASSGTAPHRGPSWEAGPSRHRN